MKSHSAKQKFMLYDALIIRLQSLIFYVRQVITWMTFYVLITSTGHLGDTYRLRWTLWTLWNSVNNFSKFTREWLAATVFHCDHLVRQTTKVRTLTQMQRMEYWFYKMNNSRATERNRPQLQVTLRKNYNICV